MDGHAPAPEPAAPTEAAPPGAAFGEAPAPARPFDPGMGLAVARRTILRPEDREDFGCVGQA